jgi:putative peptidoglycan lipid II flippase
MPCFLNSAASPCTSWFLSALKRGMPKRQTPNAPASAGLSATSPPSGRPALLVAAGIMLSRIAGLIRDRSLAHFLGSTDAADAFRAALRIPNILQNLFGEGVLSASFIPTYARLLGSNEKEEADRVASVIGSLLAVVIASCVVAGILVTPLLIEVIAPGFTGDKRALTITLVQIMFPGVGALVMSAWCLGILNSHGRFFLSYTAPVAWNLCIIAGLLIFRNTGSLSQLVIYVAWSSVAGSLAQLLVQVPTVIQLSSRLRFSLRLNSPPIQSVLHNFVPIFISRGVVQLSAYLDSVLASLLPGGSVALLGYAQNIGLLPISLFGMSISAAELPAMSRALAGNEAEVRAELTTRLTAALRRMAFFVIPAAMAFIALGDTIAAVLYQTGRFTREDTLYVWALLAGSGVGLLASTFGRLCSSAFYALRDTRTPLRFAVIRVVLTVGLGYLFAFPLPGLLHLDPKCGLPGLTASAGIAGWVEFLLLRASLQRRIGSFALPASIGFRIWGAAIFAAAIVFPLKQLETNLHPLIAGAAFLPLYGVLYATGTLILRVPESRLLTRFWKR